MRTEKLNLKSIKNVLSRDELKNIMAGSYSGGCTNLGLSIPCCQCWTGTQTCGHYTYLEGPGFPIPYDCNCYCQHSGYTGGYNDCPIARC